VREREAWVSLNNYILLAVCADIQGNDILMGFWRDESECQLPSAARTLPSHADARWAAVSS
jgi:hypothetical protein